MWGVGDIAQVQENENVEPIGPGLNFLEEIVRELKLAIAINRRVIEGLADEWVRDGVVIFDKVELGIGGVDLGEGLESD